MDFIALAFARWRYRLRRESRRREGAVRAADAFAKYGRGRHKAGLNFGDCLAYATASAAGDSLLYVGDDFKHTDLPPVP